MRSRIEDALATIVAEATARGPGALAELLTALQAYRSDLYEVRRAMPITAHLRCAVCGRHWHLPITVGSLHDVPDDCPTCFDAAPNNRGLRSQLTGWAYADDCVEW